MSTKVVRNIQNREEKFTMRHFSEVARGETPYSLKSFSSEEELSVQDMFSATGEEEPDTIETREDEITDKDYLPPSKLAKAEDGPIGQKVEMPRAKHGDEFVESDVFCDIEEGSPEYPKKVLRNDPDNPSDTLNDGEVLNEQDVQQVQELEAKLKESAEKQELLEASIAEKNAEIVALKEDIEKMKAELPQQLDAAKTEGVELGSTEAQVKYEKQYEAEKRDYMAKLEAFNSASLKELSTISAALDGVDEQLGDIVTGFVKTIIGTERKLNDQFIANFIKHHLSRLNDLKDIRFSVNPADLDVLKAAFPDYVVSTDTSLAKGSARVITKIGEVVLDHETMVEDLEKQIKIAFAAEKA